MATVAASRPARIFHMIKNGFGAPVIVMGMLAMIMVPLATPVLDAVFSFNIAMSLVILLAVVYVQRPLEFSSRVGGAGTDCVVNMLFAQFC